MAIAARGRRVHVGTEGCKSVQKCAGGRRKVQQGAEMYARVYGGARVCKCRKWPLQIVLKVQMNKLER